MERADGSGVLEAGLDTRHLDDMVETRGTRQRKADRTGLPRSSNENQLGAENIGIIPEVDENSGGRSSRILSERDEQVVTADEVIPQSDGFFFRPRETALRTERENHRQRYLLILGLVTVVRRIVAIVHTSPPLSRNETICAFGNPSSRIRKGKANNGLVPGRRPEKQPVVSAIAP
jgi:hypothetical protein